MALPPPPPTWVMDMNSPLPSKPKNTIGIPDPPGFSSASKTKKLGPTKDTQLRKPPTAEETNILKLKKAWEVAFSPAKSIPMNAIMMYMSGSSLQIFSIMMLYTLFSNPIKALLVTNSAFSRFESEGTKNMVLGCKLVYVSLQLVLLGMGVWKVDKMGLLPTTRSDWLAWETEREPLERAYFAFNVR